MAVIDQEYYETNAVLQVTTTTGLENHELSSDSPQWEIDLLLGILLILFIGVPVTLAYCCLKAN